MSGIAAIVRTDGAGVEPGLIGRMTAAMDYRGPDGIHCWSEGAAALGHCAMHASAESRASMQPLASQDGSTVAVMDGFLANYQELRRSLLERGARLRDRSEAELILHAYDQWGDECLPHLDGEFAFVLWDKQRGRAFCGRDHLGLRPIHYHFDGSTLLVATDIAGVLAAMPQQPPINRQVLAEVMACEWLSREATVWQGISRLLPAHWMAFEGGQLRSRRYWQIPGEVSLKYKSDEQYTEHYSEMLTQCIAEACRTDAPLGCEVSGGLDSSAIFATAHALQQDGQIAAPQLRGYTFDAPAGSDADESSYVRDLEEMLGVTVARVPLFLPPLSWFEAQSKQDKDIATYSNTAMLRTLGQRLASDGCRISLNGQGGDQWLNGTYFYYAQALADGSLGLLTKMLKQDAQAFGLRRTAKLALQHGVAPLLPPWLEWIRRPFRNRLRFSPTEDREELYWLAPDLRADLINRREESRRNAADYHSTFNQVKAEHPFQLRFHESHNRQAARLGYEPRSPMFSRRFIEFAAMTPERIRFGAGTRKLVHRKAFLGKIPESVRTRTTKAEFSLASDQLSESIAKIFSDPEQYHQYGLFNEAGLERLTGLFCDAAIDAGVSWEVLGSCSSYLFAKNFKW